MLTSLDWLVILLKGLSFVSMLSFALIFLMENTVIRYVAMSLVILMTAYAVFFGLMVGITGYFVGQLAVVVIDIGFVIAFVVLEILCAKHFHLF